MLTTLPKTFPLPGQRDPRPAEISEMLADWRRRQTEKAYEDFYHKRIGRFWTTREGAILEIAKMETRHLENCAAMMWRNDAGTGKLTASDFYLWITEELDARKRMLSC
jgi:hypothetical protein